MLLLLQSTPRPSHIFLRGGEAAHIRSGWGPRNVRSVCVVLGGSVWDSTRTGQGRRGRGAPPTPSGNQPFRGIQSPTAP